MFINHQRGCSYAHHIQNSLLLASRQGEDGYEATKTGAVGANRCQYHASLSAAAE